MDNKEFFIKRYEKLGWKYKKPKINQAIRINTLNFKKKDLIKRLESLGILLEKISFLQNGYWIKKTSFSVGAITEYLLGYYSMQEAASQIPCNLFTALKDKVVLDACAAPGGKTVQLANLMENTGIIYALDIKKHRINALNNHLERCNIKNTVVYHMNATDITKLKTKFDRILLDVPCSGNLTIDNKWFIKRKINDVKRNAKLQKKLLTEASKILKDEGEIVYSTCSLEPEENELNIEWAINNLKLKIEKVNCFGEKGLINIFGKKIDSTIENCRRIWPNQTQGFFYCKLKKMK